MRTGFAGHVDPSFARFGHERDSASATDVDDVKPTAGFRGDIDRAANRFEFSRNRSRVQVIADTFFSRGARLTGQLARHLLRFGVDSDEQVELGGALHSSAQRWNVDMREIANAAVAHERFQPDGAAIAQCLQVSQISGNQSAPKTEIDERVCFRGGAF